MNGVILHIGPITLPDGQQGDSLFFLHPADPDAPPVLAPDLAAALASLTPRGSTPACEPALGGQAHALGLAVADLTASAREALALMALDLAGSDFKDIASEELVVPFCTAMAGFVARQGQVGADAPCILAVDLDDGTRLSALLIGGPGLVLSREPDLALTEGLAAICSESAPEIIDALARSHGLTCLPGAFRLADGEKHRVSDRELAILTATADAISALAPARGATASGRVRSGGQDVGVTVTTP